VLSSASESRPTAYRHVSVSPVTSSRNSADVVKGTMFVSFDEMIEGEAPDGDLFPLLWSAAGRRDDDSRYPRGFATSWAAQRRDLVNESGKFEQLQAEMRKA